MQKLGLAIIELHRLQYLKPDHQFGFAAVSEEVLVYSLLGSLFFVPTQTPIPDHTVIAVRNGYNLD